MTTPLPVDALATVIAALKEKHGTVHVLTGAGEQVIVRSPNADDWRKFRKMAFGWRRYLVAETLFRACCLYPIQRNFSGGKLGSMAARYAKTGSGLWANLTSAPDRILMDLNESAGYAKAKRALENVNAALDPTSESGKRIKSAALDAFNRITGGALDKLQDPKQVEKMFLKIIDIIEKRFVPAAERLAKAIGKIADGIDSIGKAFDFVDAATKWSPFRVIPKITSATRDFGERLSRWGSTPNPPDDPQMTLDPKRAVLLGMPPPDFRRPQPPPAAAKPPPKPTAMQFGPGAFQFNIHGAQDPKAVGDEVEERMASVFERLGIAQGVA